MNFVIGTTLPININDVDTDQIIPAHWMKKTEKFGYENGLFENWRKDKNFIMNFPDRQAATIIIGGHNFGCGSSREHAVWALRDAGFKAVIAPSFGDIFKTNLPNVGLIPIEIDTKNHEKLMRNSLLNPQLLIRIDVKNQVLTTEEKTPLITNFSLDELSKQLLLKKSDLIEYTLNNYETLIKSYEIKRESWLPGEN